MVSNYQVLGGVAAGFDIVGRNLPGWQVGRLATLTSIRLAVWL